MERTLQSPLLDIAHLIVPMLWLGLLAGVSFIATPAKFGAPSLSLAVALDVGRATFSLFNNIEWVMFAFLVTVVVLSGPFFFSSIATILLGIVLFLQTVWLLPVLNQRIAAIIAGGVPAPSSDHLFYIGADLVKLGLLIAIVWNQSERLSPLLSSH